MRGKDRRQRGLLVLPTPVIAQFGQHMIDQSQRALVHASTAAARTEAATLRAPGNPIPLVADLAEKSCEAPQRMARTSCLKIALLAVGIHAVACSRTPLGITHSQAHDGSADHLDASSPSGSESEVLSALPPDFSPDLRPDVQPDLSPGGVAPTAAFTSVTADGLSCGLRTDSTIACWGYES